MLNFIDTNVLVGYCFHAHNFNDQCQILEKMPNLWLSDKVLIEWNRKERIIQKELEDKIRRHAQDISRKLPDMIEIDHRDRLIGMADNKVRPFFQKLYLDIVTYPILKDELCGIIENILLSMQADKRQRLTNLMAFCQKHERRIEYPSKESALTACVHNGDGDRGIILDAHDLVLNPFLNKQNDELQFWTFDGGISITCKEKIISNLKIKDVIDLRYYLPAAHLSH
jgi:hypothetical protein